MSEVEHTQRNDTTSSDDYILVDHTSTDFSDDDSYDYCDDVLPLGTVASASDSSIVYDDDEDDEEKGTHNNPHHPNRSLKDMILTVPCNLMKDLDEAHAAAELVTLTTESTPLSSEGKPSEKDHDDAPNSVSEKPPVTIPMDEVSVMTTPEKRERSASGKDDELEAAPKAPVMMSRASNKKRRKKLKMMKKAQAAQHAAEALKSRNVSTDDSSNTPKPSSGKKSTKQATIMSSRSKKSTNLAVVCATQTLAAYKQELMKNGHHACT